MAPQAQSKPQGASPRSKKLSVLLPTQPKKAKVTPQRSPAKAKPKPTIDEYEFPADQIDHSEMATLAKKLKSGGPKEQILKALKQLSALLESAPQDAAQLGGQGDSLAQSLLSLASAADADKDVKVYSTQCMVFILRMYAPDTPYKDPQLKQVFTHFLWALERLSQPQQPTFPIVTSMLHVAVETRLYLLLLDLEEGSEGAEGEGDGLHLVDSLVSTILSAARCSRVAAHQYCGLDTIFLSMSSISFYYTPICQETLSRWVWTELSLDKRDLGVVLLLYRPNNMDALEGPAQQLLCGILEEGGAEVLTEGLLAAMLRALAGTMPGGHAAQRLAGRVLQRNEMVLRSALQRPLAQLVSGEEPLPAAAPHLRQHAAELLAQVHLAAPAVLLPVLPMLQLELESTEESKRLAAVHLMACMLCAPESSIAEQYTGLLKLYLQRYRDMSPDVRLQMLQDTVCLATSSIGPVQEQAIQLAAGRLHDTDETVRVAAVRVLCELASSHLARIPHAVLRELLARLRDAKSGVRKEAASGLVQAFRALAGRLAKEGTVPDTLDAALLTVPAYLAAAARVDPEMRAYTHTLLITPGLLPSTGAASTPAGAANVWALVWAASDTKGQEALLILLRMKAELARRVAVLLAVRARMQRSKKAAPTDGDAQSPEVYQWQRRFNNLCQEVVQGMTGHTTPNSLSKPLTQLQALCELKDGKVFERLASLCDQHTPEAAARAARKDLLERVGSKSSLGNFVGMLTAAIMPTLISPSTLLALSMSAAPLPPRTSPATAQYIQQHVAQAVSQPSNSKASPDKNGASTQWVSPSEMQDGTHPPGVAAAAAQLLCAAAKLAPQLFVGVLPYMAAVLVEASPEPHDMPNGNVHGATEENATGGDDKRAPGSAGKGKRGAAGKQAAKPKKTGGKQQDVDQQGATQHGGQAAAAGTTQTCGVVNVEAALVSLTVMANAMRERADIIKQGNKLAPLPDKLKDCLHRLCMAGPPKAAQLSVYVLASMAVEDAVKIDPSTSSQAAQAEYVASLAEELSATLTEENLERPEGLAAVHALCSIGKFAPNTFTEYAEQLVDFVTQLLAAPHPGGLLSDDQGEHADGSQGSSLQGPLQGIPRPPKVYLGQSAPQGSTMAHIKAGLLRAVAKACSPAPEAGAVPSGTHTAANILIPLLASLCDVDTDLSVFGLLEAEDLSVIRLAAARGLLMLSTRHDTLMSPTTYSTLALALQDPSSEVRAVFGTKLMIHVSKLQVQAASSTTTQFAYLPSKYAAMLPLTAVTPDQKLRSAAAQQLRTYCNTKRAAAQAALQHAALEGKAGSSSGAGMLPYQPEFMLPFLVYLLSSHPDCPYVDPTLPSRIDGKQLKGIKGEEEEEEQDEGEDGEEGDEVLDQAAALVPFSCMLQMLLEPLLALPTTAVAHAQAGKAGTKPERGSGKSAAANTVMSNLPLVRKVLLHTKLAGMMENVVEEDEEQTQEDATERATHMMRSMCDLGLALCDAITKRECARAGVPPPDNSAIHPAQVVLPKLLFDTKVNKQKQREGDHLPEDYKAQLDKGITELHAGNTQPATQAGRKRAARRKRQAHSDPGAGGKRSKAKTTARSAQASDDATEGAVKEEELSSGSSKDNSPRPVKRRKKPAAASDSGEMDGDAVSDECVDGSGKAMAKKKARGRGPAAKKAIKVETPTRRMPQRTGRPANMGVDIASDDDIGE